MQKSFCTMISAFAFLHERKRPVTRSSFTKFLVDKLGYNLPLNGELLIQRSAAVQRIRAQAGPQHDSVGRRFSGSHAESERVFRALGICGRNKTVRAREGKGEPQCAQKDVPSADARSRIRIEAAGHVRCSGNNQSCSSSCIPARIVRGSRTVVRIMGILAKLCISGSSRAVLPGGNAMLLPAGR